MGTTQTPETDLLKDDLTGGSYHTSTPDSFAGSTKKTTHNPKSVEKKLVQMRLSENTLDKIDSMSSITGITNRTHLIAAAVQIAEVMIKETHEGGKIVLRRPDGSVRELTIVGI